VVKASENRNRYAVTMSYGYRSDSTSEAIRSCELETSALHLYLAAAKSNECWISAAPAEF